MASEMAPFELLKDGGLAAVAGFMAWWAWTERKESNRIREDMRLESNKARDEYADRMASIVEANTRALTGLEAKLDVDRAIIKALQESKTRQSV